MAGSMPPSLPSRLQAAKALGVSHTQIQNDLARNLPKNGKKLAADAREAKREGEGSDRTRN